MPLHNYLKNNILIKIQSEFDFVMSLMGGLISKYRKVHSIRSFANSFANFRYLEFPY